MFDLREWNEQIERGVLDAISNEYISCSSFPYRYKKRGGDEDRTTPYYAQF